MSPPCKRRPPSIDLVIGNVQRAELTVDPQSLAAAGEVSATVTNLGPDRVNGPFDVLFFEDLNHNGNYDLGVDTALGRMTVAGGLAGGASANVAVRVAGALTFPGAFVWAFVDSGNAVPESNEGNNVARNEVHCQYIPPVGQFNPVIELYQTNYVVLPNSVHVTMTPAVMDLNGDGIPDIVYTTFANGEPSTMGTLRAISGQNGTELWSVTNLAHRVMAPAGIAIGDLNSDGVPDIVAIHGSSP